MFDPDNRELQQNSPGPDTEQYEGSAPLESYKLSKSEQQGKFRWWLGSDSCDMDTCAWIQQKIHNWSGRGIRGPCVNPPHGKNSMKKNKQLL